MWKVHKDFLYKEMKYNNSCFPCSLHVILSNLKYVGYRGKDETVIEDLWNEFHKDLNKTAPNEIEVHQYLSNTPYLFGRGVLYTPTSFQNKAVAQNICERIRKDFLQSRKSAGLIAGIGHAEVFYKNGTKGYIHFNPSTDHESIICESIEIKDVRVLEALCNGQESYAIGIDYLVNNQVSTQAADFIFIIS